MYIRFRDSKVGSNKVGMQLDRSWSCSFFITSLFWSFSERIAYGPQKYVKCTFDIWRPDIFGWISQKDN